MSDKPGGLPALAIRRPILVVVMNLLIVLAGLAALRGVEVRELPDVEYPLVSINARYPGASPETMDAEVTRVIEQAVSRVSGIYRIRSSSEENEARVRVEFLPGVDLDVAASDVREAVSRITRRLPDDVDELMIYKSDPDAQPIINISAVADAMSTEDLSYLLETDVIPELIAVPGVADVVMYGNRQRMLRVVVDPLRLTSYGLSISDLAETLKQAPFDMPAGSFSSADQQLLVRADASAITPAAVEELIIRGSTRIGDVANVFYGPEDARSYVRLNGRSVIGLGVVRQAQSNAIDISDGVMVALKRLNQRLDSVELIVTSDSATFIRDSVREVMFTLVMTAVIVIVTLWLFLGNLRATLVPSVAIPVALIGTVAAIWLFGFSINILTLLALVLATGLVVDDAIVVLENIQRRRAQGLEARAAAVLGTRQVFFAVVATTAVLVAVFVPIAFLPGTAGQLFREFGVVLAVSVALSAFVALSLVPAMASRLPDSTLARGPVNAALARFGAACAELYGRLLRGVLNYPLTSLVVGLALAVAAGLLYHMLDKELVPREDRGIIFVDATGPDGVGLPYSERQARQIEALMQPLLDSGEVESLFTVVGSWDLNRVRLTAKLAPWEQRSRSQQEIIAELESKLSNLPGVQVRLFSTNSLNIRGGGGRLQFALTGSEYPEIHAVAQRLAAALEDRSTALSQVRISYSPSQAQLSLDIDRRRAADLGIPLDGLSTTLRAMIDGDEIVDLNVGDEAVPILLETAGARIRDPSDLMNLYVSAADGALLPLSSIVTLREEGVAAELERHGQRRAIEIDARLAAGYPMQAAVDELRAVAAELLPPNIGLLLLGEAATLEETSSDVGLTYAIALLVVFLVLCAQFESLTSSTVVMAIVPFGIAAAIFALFLTGISINIYSQIGLVMLIGLMAKNGILLVEFADQLRDQGRSVREAIIESAKVRLRPVMMTMLSTVLGALPLILSTGAGAEARHSIGWVIFGGLGIAGMFTLFLTPVVYLGVAPLSKPRAAESERLERELEAAVAVQSGSDETLRQAS